MASTSPPHPAVPAPGIDLEPTSFSSLDGWQQDDHLAAFEAFCQSARQWILEPYKPKLIDIDPQSFAASARRALNLQERLENSNAEVRHQATREFFESAFVPNKISATPSSTGFVTGYYEPELAASWQQTAEFSVPLYKRPEDLIDLDEYNRPEDMDSAVQFARDVDGEIVPYFDRGEIQNGALDGRGLELAWLRDKTDAFFVHVQGSARLTFSDNQRLRIGFAAKNGFPYTSLGKVVCELENIPPDQMTADHLAAWMRDHPDSLDELMAMNRSYIFFRHVEESAAANGGPVGAANVSLTPGRSLAVDKTVHQYGLPIWVSAARDLMEEGRNFSRLMVAQDTGSAIVGLQRGDIFVGSGENAGRIAGRIRDDAEFTLLVPAT